MFEGNADLSQVILSWLTASEYNNAGFNIYRKSTGNSDDWDLINLKLIAGQGNTSEETEYQYIDNDISCGDTVEYKLESLSFTGYRNEEQSIKVVIPVPKDYVLFNNYPNPFNPTTNLKFQLPKDSKISVYIYDTNGRLVRKLTSNVFYKIGEHIIQWNAMNDYGQKIASGMYLYRFVADKFVKTGKMILIK